LSLEEVRELEPERRFEGGGQDLFEAPQGLRMRAAGVLGARLGGAHRDVEGTWAVLAARQSIEASCVRDRSTYQEEEQSTGPLCGLQVKLLRPHAEPFGD